MDDEAEDEVAVGVGAQLRSARLDSGLTLEQVAMETRLAIRQLEAIEDGRFADLPARTYAVGFSRTYARLVGLDPEEVAAKVRAELDAQAGHDAYTAPQFEPGDPARLPSARLGWYSAAALVLLLIGAFVFMRLLFSPAAELPTLVQQEQAERAVQQAELAERSEAALEGENAANAPTGAVVFTSLEDGIWVKFYDASGRQLMQKLMQKGESYTVPADADGPQVWTGRPDAFAITIGGRAVRKLAEEDMVMRDVPVTAEALLARAEPASTGTQAGASPTT